MRPLQVVGLCQVKVTLVLCLLSPSKLNVPDLNSYMVFFPASLGRLLCGRVLDLELGLMAPASNLTGWSDAPVWLLSPNKFNVPALKCYIVLQQAWADYLVNMQQGNVTIT